jgi:hypothetical protein
VSSGIKSWSIYENKNGCVNLNIRFATYVDDNTGHSGSVDFPVTYRKVGARQLERSRARARQYQNNNTVDTTMHTPVPGAKLFNPSTHKEILTSNSQSPPHIPPPILPPIHESECKKRKIDDHSPETFRLDPNIIDNYNVHTPETVVKGSEFLPSNDTPDKYETVCSETIEIFHDAECAIPEEYDLDCPVEYESTDQVSSSINKTDEYTPPPIDPSNSFPSQKSTINDFSHVVKADINKTICPNCEDTLTVGHICKITDQKISDPPVLNGLAQFLATESARFRASNKYN